MRVSIFLFLFYFGLSMAVQASSYRGFLLTKDGYRLTGYLHLLEYAPSGNVILFSNDFGDEYVIHPMVVRGFGFQKDGEVYRFESRFYDGLWIFLREDFKGKALRLYRLPNASESWVDDRVLQLFSRTIPTYWIGYSHDKLHPVGRIGYKRNLRDFFSEASPELSAKIGKRGYRYRNLRKIVMEFDEKYGRRKRRL